MTSFNKLAISALLSALSLPVLAQVHAGDSVMEHANGKRLSIGGYGEVGYTRNFFSDHVSRYSQPEQHKDDPSHGKFDIPHAVIYVGYDFGKGWSMGTEIEFEHGGAGIAYEKEDEEGGEWEQETEKGGEVELEQFWIQKSFGRFANIRAGHIVVPVGLNNAHHEPLNFFTVYRPEGENTILPSTWHQTGVSFWGRQGDFRYEAQLLAGLNADHFTNTGWIHKGHKSPLEYDIANKYGVAARLDNYSLPGLRVALSGYYGQSIGNSYPRNANGVDNEYKGTVLVGSFDFTYNAHNWIVRGQADYGYLGDAEQLKYVQVALQALRLREQERLRHWHRGRLRRLLASAHHACRRAETLRLRTLRDVRPLCEQHQEHPLRLHHGEAHGRRRELPPHPPDSRESRILPPFPQEAIQRRALGEHRHRLRGFLPLTPTKPKITKRHEKNAYHGRLPADRSHHLHIVRRRR